MSTRLTAGTVGAMATRDERTGVEAGAKQQRMQECQAPVGKGRLLPRPALLGVALLALTVTTTVALTACGGGNVTYKDGVYTAQSSVFEDSEDGNGNGYGVVTLTIADGKIADAEFLTYEPDGTLKDEDYGKANGAIANQDFYNKAQRAVAASAEYAKQLVAVGNLDGVDVISGATISYGEFQEAVQNALDQAAE